MIVATGLFCLRGLNFFIQTTDQTNLQWVHKRSFWGIIAIQRPGEWVCFGYASISNDGKTQDVYTQIIEVYFQFVMEYQRCCTPSPLIKTASHLSKNKKLAHEVCWVVPFFAMFVCFEIITAWMTTLLNNTDDKVTYFSCTKYVK